jgi:hypothetical protein
MIIKTKYGEYDVKPVWGRYASGNRSLRLFSREDGIPVMVVSVDLNVELKDDEMLIKNWSENEGILEELQRYEIIGKVIEEIPTGFVHAQRVKLINYDR